MDEEVTESHESQTVEWASKESHPLPEDKAPRPLLMVTTENVTVKSFERTEEIKVQTQTHYITLLSCVDTMLTKLCSGLDLGLHSGARLCFLFTRP